VVIAILAILASMLLPALAKAKGKAQQAACVNNVKQLNLALFLYADDHQDTFPGAASKGAYEPMREDWIFGNVNRSVADREFFNNPRHSALAPYLGNFTTNLFRCPADVDARKRQQAFDRNPRAGNPYLYSYSLTSVVDSQNRGISSIYAPGLPPLHFRGAQIRSPAQKLTFAEENGDPAHAEPLDDGRFVPPGNILSARHKFPTGTRVSPREFMDRGRGTAGFADGHVQAVTPRFASDPQHYDATR
jgi:prepilin-type processing-associated H-X9-DG protein